MNLAKNLISTALHGIDIWKHSCKFVVTQNLKLKGAVLFKEIHRAPLVWLLRMLRTERGTKADILPRTRSRSSGRRRRNNLAIVVPVVTHNDPPQYSTREVVQDISRSQTEELTIPPHLQLDGFFRTSVSPSPYDIANGRLYPGHIGTSLATCREYASSSSNMLTPGTGHISKTRPRHRHRARTDGGDNDNGRGPTNVSVRRLDRVDDVGERRGTVPCERDLRYHSPSSFRSPRTRRVAQRTSDVQPRVWI